MNKYVLITSGVLANKIEIRKDNNNGEILYTTSKSLLSRFLLLAIRPWYNPVNFVLKGHNGINDLKIRTVAKDHSVLIENDTEIGSLKGRKLIDTNYNFSISLDKESYFFKGDPLVLLTKAYKNNIEIGSFKIYNQTFPHFDWESTVGPDMDKRIAAVGLLYNYLIWSRV
ncbi:hypothetical protein C3495_13835 (plasmid) [Clostridiaceae bacterium 14S0207]|nr:hypothetical protein C3495_13835 [Clostridiaceae bacterium 14S0207]